MSRKLFAAAVVVLAAGALLLAGPAEASNMGFKLERTFRTIPGFPGNYYVSFPLYNGLADLANTAGATVQSPCTNHAGGPAMGDNIINSHDAICDLWTDKKGAFTLSRFNHETCFVEPETFQLDFLGNVTPSNTWTAPLNPEEAFQVNAPYAAGDGALMNSAVIVGSHDPTAPARAIELPNSGCTPVRVLMNVPYHTMYQNAVEILCGLEGMAWDDVNDNSTGMPPADGWPDTCPTGEGGAGGIFDQDHKISVQFYDNIDDFNGTDNSFVPLSIEKDFLGNLQFTGTNFPLVPGDGYMAVLTPGHTPTTYLSPFF